MEERVHKVNCNERRQFRFEIDYSSKSLEIKVPEFLYKYYKPNKYSLSVLKERKIYASNAYEFNDPFDSTPLYWKIDSFPEQAALRFLKGRYPTSILDSCKTVDSIRNLYFKNVLDFFGIYCLNDGNHEDLFWGYYNEHRGIRIKFKTNILNEQLKIEPFKVEYLDESEFLNQQLFLEKSEVDGLDIIIPKIIRWLTVKKDIWENENEWRYILPACRDTETRKIPFDLCAIDTITLGYKFFEGNELLSDNGKIFKRRFKQSDNLKGNDLNYSFEILRFLYENSHIPLYQVALTNDIVLYPLKIQIEDVNGNDVTIRQFLPNTK